MIVLVDYSGSGYLPGLELDEIDSSTAEPLRISGSFADHDVSFIEPSEGWLG